MPTLGGRHLDGYSAVIVLLLVVYGLLFFRWLRFGGAPHGPVDALDMVSPHRRRSSLHRLGGRRGLNFSQWVADPAVADEPCCPFLQRLRDTNSSLRYRFGIEYQSCCNEPYEGTSFQPLRFVGPASFDAAAFMAAIRGKKVVFIGDSLMRQTITALICALEREGIVPTAVEKPAQQPWGAQYDLPPDDNMDFSATFEDGTKLERVSMRQYLNSTFSAALAYADVLFVNLGAWYRRGQRLVFQDDLGGLLARLATFAAQPDKVGVLVDTLPQHFRTRRGSGDFHEKSGMQSCTAVRPERFFRSGGDWHSKIARKLAKEHSVTFIEVVDVFLPRGDAHLEFRPKSNPQGKMIRRLDCSHWCQRHSLWAPLIARLSATVQDSWAKD